MVDHAAVGLVMRAARAAAPADLFVFQALDAITNTVCAEWRVRIGDTQGLKLILAPESDDDADLSG